MEAEIKEEISELFGESIANNEVTEEMVDSLKEATKEVLNTAEFNLDAALDTYDPTFPGYIPSENALEFFNLMRLVQGGDFEFATPKAHYFMVDLLLNEITDVHMFPYNDEVCESIQINHLRLAFMASRGISKSTLIISFFGVYSAIKGTLPNGIGDVWFYVVLAASSRGGARVNALAVRAMCEDSVFLKDYFEEMRFTESESEFVRKGNGPRKNRSFLIRYQGIGTGIRGARYGERRPCALILDDILLNEAAAYSKTIIANVDSLIYSDAESALKGGGKGRIINCFTPFHYADNNTKTVIEGSYTPCVIPLAKNFDPENKALKATNILSSWEAMHPAKSIRQMVLTALRARKLKAFLQERMLRLSSGADRLIPESSIQFCKIKPIIDNIHNYNVYITTDFTTTSGENSDYSGNATWAVSDNGDYFMIGLTLRKRSMRRQYYDVLDEAQKYKMKGKQVEIGVEIDGNQSAHIYSLEEIMRQRGDWYTFAKPKSDPYSTRKGILSRSSGVDKHERFRIASTTINQGKLWFPEELRDTPDMRLMLDQIRGATHTAFTKADDGPDLITMLLVTMHVRTPITTVKRKKTSAPVGFWDEFDTESIEDAGAGYR